MVPVGTDFKNLLSVSWLLHKKTPVFPYQNKNVCSECLLRNLLVHGIIDSWKKYMNYIIWCTKYRKPVFTAGIDIQCKELLEKLAAQYSFRILAMEDMVKIMKGTWQGDCPWIIRN